MGYVHSRNQPPRAVRKESFASLRSFCCERKIFEEFISGLFHGDSRGREGTSSVDFVERGSGPPACRAYRASFLPLDWSAPSNWRSRKKKVKKRRQRRRSSLIERKGGRKREADEEGRSEWREEREQRLLPSRKLLLDRNVERPRWLVRLDSSKSGIGYDKYRSWGIKSEPRISPRRAWIRS